MIKLKRVLESPDSMCKILVFEFNWQLYRVNINPQISWLIRYNPSTALETEFTIRMLDYEVEKLHLKVLEMCNIHPESYSINYFVKELAYILVNREDPIVIKQEIIDNTPEEVKEALRITKKAMELEKETIRKTVELQQEKNNYFRKYWTFMEKFKTY